MVQLLEYWLLLVIVAMYVLLILQTGLIGVNYMKFRRERGERVEGEAV